MTYTTLQKDVEYIAKKAGNLLQDMQSTATVAVQKDVVDISTSADLASEKLIVSFIHDHYPEHGILSEEMGSVNVDNAYVWVIDPLDETKEYMKGIHEYGCLIAIEENGIVVAGSANIIGPNDVYSSSLHNGAYHNSKSIHVSSESLETSFVSFHIPLKINGHEQIHNNVKLLEALINKAYRIRCNNFDAKALGYVARGVYAAHIIPSHLPKWWDVAPSLLLVEEAGGKVTDWYGKPIKNRNLSHGIVASNGKIHKEILAIIKDNQL